MFINKTTKDFVKGRPEHLVTSIGITIIFSTTLASYDVLDMSLISLLTRPLMFGQSKSRASVDVNMVNSLDQYS